MRQVLLAGLVVVFCSFAAFAAVPRTINYQGRLAGSDGTPVNAPVQMVFAIYNVAAGGTAVWTETQTVQVNNGIYAVALGAVTPIDPALIDGSLWLGVKVGTDAEMTPRQALHSVPFALRAAAVAADGPLNLTASGANGDVTLIPGSGGTVNVSNARVANVADPQQPTDGVNKRYVDARLPLSWQVVAGPEVQALSNKGYIADSAAPVNITLPQNPAVGDVVRVVGKGQGGWKIVRNPGQEIVDSNMELSFSPLLGCGLPVDPITPVSIVAEGSDSLILSAMPDSACITVDGGKTWHERNWTAAPIIPRVDYGLMDLTADGSRMYAIVGGALFLSEDLGVTWNPMTSPGVNAETIQASTNGEVLLAVALDELGSRGLYKSTDFGTSWAKIADEVALAGASGPIAMSADGMKVALRSGGRVLVSVNSGQDWNILSQPEEITDTSWGQVHISADGSALYFVCLVASQGVFVSYDRGSGFSPLEFYFNGSFDSFRLFGENVMILRDGITLSSSFITEYSHEVYYERILAAGKHMIVAAQGNAPTSTLFVAYNSPAVEQYVVGGKGTSIELLYVGDNQFAVLSRHGEMAYRF